MVGLAGMCNRLLKQEVPIIVLGMIQIATMLGRRGSIDQEDFDQGLQHKQRIVLWFRGQPLCTS